MYPTHRHYSRVQPAALAPGGGLPGTALPAKATMPLTPQMTQQIQKLPPQATFHTGEGAALQTGGGGPAGTGATRHPGQTGTVRSRADLDRGRPRSARPRPGQVQPGVPAQPAQVQPGVPAQPGQVNQAPDPTGSGATRCPASRSGQTGRIPPGCPARDANHTGCSRGHEAQRRASNPRHQGLDAGAAAAAGKRTPATATRRRPPRPAPSAASGTASGQPKPAGPAPAAAATPGAAAGPAAGTQPRPQPQVQPRPQPEPRPQPQAPARSAAA